MIQFVELCVDLKKGKLAKDGLYQYKNTAQNTNVGTIEVRENDIEYFRSGFADSRTSTACAQKVHDSC